MLLSGLRPIGGIKLKRLFILAAAAGLFAVTAGSAQAVTIDFENINTDNAPGLPFLSDGDYVTQNGYYFQSRNSEQLEGYLEGTISNGSDPEACLTDVCPGGNPTNYLVGLNDGFFEFGRLDFGKSSLLSFDAAYVSATNLPPMAIPAYLSLVAFYADGSFSEASFALGAIGAGGTTSFNSYHADFAAGADFFLAIGYRCNSDTGRCTAFDTNEGQFALDNIVFENVGPGATVPEPATWAMLLLGFGGVGTMLRRQRNRLPLAA